ncbi:copper chaperone PCu(A)C [Vibrio sp. CAU 1672]|uniref:copper chaperone PCu(A)C n=1 Tax=Vibrio sp. CAU 1672 TaxID=3032594 RepID=UPI0023DAB6C3|nr:copper chaperone PCu(A)C [Vibrio sp. CAU 1672]MDF2153032.1 copper chaperone PCu(A)C [Vibrio sp. CAU 1672]
MKVNPPLSALLLSALAISPFAYADNDIKSHHAYARAMAPSATTSAVFVTFANQGDHNLAIVSASTPAAGNVELHDVIKEGDVMKMRQIDQITLAANDKTELKPGSLHIMLFDLKQRLNEGDQIEVTVQFDNGQQYTFTAPVKKVMSGMKKHAQH